MIKLLQLIFLGHAHKWKLHREEAKEYTSPDGRKLRTVRVFLLQCETCGDFKGREIG